MTIYLALIFHNKTVLVTGHTGFKGSWLAAWLKHLGAGVAGVSLEPPSDPSHFNALGLAQTIKDYRVDIRDREALAHLVVQVQPDFVFHLADLAHDPDIGFAHHTPIHIVCGWRGEQLCIITVYVPKPPKFITPWKRKAGAVKKYLNRIKKVSNISLQTFLDDIDVQDIILFNIQLAVQNCIDIAAYIISTEDMGMPGSTNEMFYLL